MMAAAPTAPSSYSFPRARARLYISSSKPGPGNVGIISRKQSVVMCSVSKEDGIGSISISTKRRQALFQMTFSALFLFPAVSSLPSLAVDEFRLYSDDVNKFQISIPQDWQVGEGESDGFKSITAFYPEEAASASNVSVAITGIGPDFTRLESFGKVDAFAESLVNGLDRSWQRPPGIAAKLIDCKAANGLYYIEYTLQQPGESRRHIYSAIGMANNGWYNRLYTVTGQFVEDESDKFRSKIEKPRDEKFDIVVVVQAVQSFRLG